MKLNEYNASTSVYIEQITNHIQLGQGYQQLRKHLFRELNHSDNQALSEDKLSDSIVSFLTTTINKTVNFHRSQQTHRILQIIEDLLTYADEAMTPAMHNQLFVSALINIANPKIITFNSELDSECRTHSLGIFLYWFNRFGRDQQCNYELFINGYKDLKNKKLIFPQNVFIKPNDFFKKQLEDAKATNDIPPPQLNTNAIILQDIDQFTLKTQAQLKQNVRSIATTQYVRLIKHKSKVLFEFTSKPNDFKQKEKQLVKDLYRRLRLVLKELEKFKQSSLQTKKSSEAEKQFVEAKITPKKMNSLQSPNNEKRQTNQGKVDSANKNSTINILDVDLLDMAPQTTTSKQKIQSTPPKKVENKSLNVDLLGDGLQKKQEQEQFFEGTLIDTNEAMSKRQQAPLFQVFSTPKKEIHDEQGVLMKQQSNKSKQSNHSFQNQQHSKNPYSFIPHNLNLTPTSSAQDDEQKKIQQKPLFSLFGLFNFGESKPLPQANIYDDEKQHYDSPHRKGKKFSQQSPRKQAEVKFQLKLPEQAKDIVNSPNYKAVEAVNYQIYAHPILSSPHSQDQQTKFELSPKKPTEDLHQIQFTTQKSGQNIKLSDE